MCFIHGWRKVKNRHTTYSDYMFIDILYVDKNANKCEVSSTNLKQKENKLMKGVSGSLKEISLWVIKNCLNQ